MRTRYLSGRPRRSPDLIRPKMAVSGAPFAPGDVTGLIVHFDSSDDTSTFEDTAGTVPAQDDLDSVKRINDQTANGNDAIQPADSASASPTLQTDETNGLNILAFDGSDDRLDYDNTDTNNMTSGFTFYIVFSREGAGSAAFAAYFTNTDTIGSGFVFRRGGDEDLLALDYGGTGVNIASQAPIGEVMLVKLQWDTADISITKNNGTPVTATRTTHSAPLGTEGSVGMRPDALERFMDFEMCEILLYENVVSSGDETSINEFLEDKWGFTLL